MGPIMESRLSSRKFLIALVAMLSSTALLSFGYISMDIWSTVTLGVSGMYLTANVVQAKASV